MRDLDVKDRQKINEELQCKKGQAIMIITYLYQNLWQVLILSKYYFHTYCQSQRTEFKGIQGSQASWGQPRESKLCGLQVNMTFNFRQIMIVGL